MSSHRDTALAYLKAIKVGEKDIRRIEKYMEHTEMTETVLNVLIVALVKYEVMLDRARINLWYILRGKRPLYPDVTCDC